MSVKSNSEIGFYVDTLIVETVLSDNKITKTANTSGLMSGLLNTVKTYIENNINSEDKVGRLINLLAPGMISVLLGGWFGTLIGLSMRVFNINVKGILGSIHDKISSLLKGGQEVSSSQVDNIVQNSIQEHKKPLTEADVERIESQKKSVSQQLSDARLLKLAMITYRSSSEINKTAGLFGVSLRKRKDRIEGNLLPKILGWIFKVAIASAGLMVAGDVVNKVLNRPNAFDGSIKDGKPVETVTPSTTQTKFKLNPSYKAENINSEKNPWIEKYTNNKSGVETMLVDFAKSVYQGLDNLDSVIRSLPAFKAVADKILWFNNTAAGDPVIFIPKMFTSKKSIVDYFIDDLAEKTK